MLNENGPSRAGQLGRKGSQTRARLLDAAHEVFTEIGYPDARVADIIGRAGTSHGTFYTYFTDKKEILVTLTGPVADSVFEAAVAPLDEGDAATAAAAAGRRVRSFLDAFAAERGFLYAWRQAGGLHPEVEQLRREFHDSLSNEVVGRIERDQQRGLIAADVDLRIASMALTQMTEAFVHGWVARGGELDDHVADQLTGLWVRSLYGVPAKRGKAPVRARKAAGRDGAATTRTSRSRA